MVYVEDIELSKILYEGWSKYSFIDVRSPGEYTEDHLPNAINIPLLNDEERAIVGTIYKRQGPKQAKLKGVEIVGPKLPFLINEIKRVVDRNIHNTVVYCWRGGSRSESMAIFCKLAGVHVLRLKKGYKAFRKLVFNFFENELGENYRPKPIVIYGPTGSGKSEIIKILRKADIPGIDLEGAASHKGSSFGFIGEPGFKTITQKYFETKLWKDFYDNRFSPYFLIEGESKKIGKVVVPKSLFSLMKEGVNILVKPSLDFRVHYTIKNYLKYADKEAIVSALTRIKKYLGQNRVQKLVEKYDKGLYEDFVKDLLENYYDPLYNKSLPAKIDFILEYKSLEEGVKGVREIFSRVTNTVFSY